MMEEVIIYTDGGCDPNPGPGGWAAVILWGEKRHELWERNWKRRTTAWS